MANLDRRRHGASMEPQRARDVLSPGQQDDGRRCNDAANLRRREAEDTFRGTLRADSRTVGKLRRVGRWSAIPDGQARRVADLRRNANQRGAELAGRIEAESTGEVATGPLSSA